MSWVDAGSWVVFQADRRGVLGFVRGGWTVQG